MNNDVAAPWFFKRWAFKPLAKARSLWVIFHFGHFAHLSYAQRYLGYGVLAPFALLHFILIGEAGGHRPNAFFDPRYFRARTRGASYADYLLKPDLWVFPTSNEFQVDEYLEWHTAEIPTTRCPLIHFLETGFEKGFNPSNEFNTMFCRRAVFRDHGNALSGSFHALTDEHGAACLTERALRHNQQRFISSIKVQELRVGCGPKRRHLLLLQADRNTCRSFSPRRSFDVLVNYYEPVFAIMHDCDHAFYQKGTKTTAVAKLLETHGNLLLSYEAVMLLDDDVLVSEDQIEALFAIRVERGLDMLQPALSQRSSCHFPHLKQPLAGSGVRLMTAVEIMMPVVSRRVLAEFGHLFSMAVSGWSLDLLLSKQIRERFGETIALAADIVCEHLRPVDLAQGRYYRNLRRAGIEPAAEAGYLALTYGLNDKNNAIRPVPYDERSPRS